MDNSIKVFEDTRLYEVQFQKYPVYLSDVRKKYPNSTFQAGLDSSKLIKYGFYLVRDSELPQTPVYAETLPVLNAETGYYERAYQIYSLGSSQYQEALDKKKSELSNEVLEVRNKVLALGKPYEFPNGEILNVQLRDGDRANILGLRQSADDTIEAGYPNEPAFEFRTYENKNIFINAVQMKALAAWAFNAYVAIMRSSWGVQNQILEAKTFEDLPEIPQTF